MGRGGQTLRAARRAGPHQTSLSLTSTASPLCAAHAKSDNKMPFAAMAAGRMRDNLKRCVRLPRHCMRQAVRALRRRAFADKRCVSGPQSHLVLRQSAVRQLRRWPQARVAQAEQLGELLSALVDKLRPRACRQRCARATRICFTVTKLLCSSAARGGVDGRAIAARALAVGKAALNKPARKSLDQGFQLWAAGRDRARHCT